MATGGQVPEPREAAVARSEAARMRAAELQQRRFELASGVPPTPETAERARLRAEESLRRARRAHRDAAERHTGAGKAHRQAAAVHEQAALRAGGTAGEAHQDAAAVHRAEATIHDIAAREQWEKQ